MGNDVADSYLRAAPRAELHVHLEGTVLPEDAKRQLTSEYRAERDALKALHLAD